MSVCGKITAGLSASCSTPIKGGTNDELTLINKDDFDAAAITRNVSNPQIIENIVLPSGTSGYVYQGQLNSNEPVANLVKARYSKGYNHQVTGKVFDISPVAKAQLELLAKGKVVAIVQNNHRGATGNCAYELYGNDQGLDLSELIRTGNDPDTEGAYSIVLKTDEAIGKESHLPATIFITDFATTKALVDGLV